MNTLDTSFFPELSDQQVGPIKIELVDLGRLQVRIASPAAPDALLDQSEVHTAYERDEYMPYWASLWPVSVFLAEEICSRGWKPHLTAIEIGCGLGLGGIAAAKMDLDVLFTDYDANAVKFAKKNCELNGITNARFALFDMRRPMRTTFDIIVVSDLIYERRNVDPLVESIDQMLGIEGIALVSDQGRPYQENFLKRLQEKGFVWTSVQKQILNSESQKVTGSVFTIKREN